MELNLEQPIFVVYVNIEGLSQQMANKTLSNYNSHYGQYTNSTFWIFPGKETKVEVIWNGSKYQLYKDLKDTSLQNMIEHVNSVLEILSEGTSDEAIKSQLRDLQLSKILD